jgi:hypothetical protein
MAKWRRHGGWGETVGRHMRELRCNGIEVMWSEVVQVAGDENGICNR